MIEAFEQVDYQPNFLMQLGLFMTDRSRTKSVSVENRDGVLKVLQTSQRGAPIEEHRTTEKRQLRQFVPPRIATDDTINADEIQDIRAFGQESELTQVMDEVNRRVDGPAGLLRNVEMTWENMGLGAVQGLVTDADGSTLFDWFGEFDVTQPTEIDFDLDNASPTEGALYLKCQQVVDATKRAAKGAWTSRSMVMGLCSETFWYDLITHPEIQSLWKLQIQGGFRDGLEMLLGNTQRIIYGGIIFVRYWGTDDGTSVAVPADKCKFFPINCPGVFKKVFAVGESFDHLNQPGRDFYPLIVRDRDRNMWVRIEIYSYPLFLCTRPLMLQRAKRT
jgi:hypothetical protein